MDVSKCPIHPFPPYRSQAVPTTTPRRIAHLSTRTCAIASAASLALAGGWGCQLWTGRPHLTLMVFALLLAVATASGVVAVVARCHLSIAQAFTAGALAARESPRPPESRSLRVVD